MDLLLISLLLFSTFSHVYLSAINEPKLWQPNTSKANSLAEALKQCICWPDGLPPTVQQLDPQNNGLERLVIYLYKNDSTNEIKMYTPNANKQMLIPEIPYEAGDGLVTATTENVYTLLYNNPNKIKVYNNHIEKLVPPVTESLAIGLNTGTIENFYPNGENYFNPNINHKSNEYPLAKNIKIPIGPNGDVVNEPEKGSTNNPYNVFPEAYNPNSNLTPDQNWMPNNYQYINPDDPQAVSLNPQMTADNAQTIPEVSLAIPVNSKSPLYTLQVTSQSFLPNAPALPYNSQDHSVNPQEIPGNPHAIPGSHVGELDPNVVYTFQSDQGSNKLKPGSQDINNPLSAQYMTFNIWFHQQMKRFQNVHLPKDIKSINGDALKIVVQKIFHENNIYVSGNGVITDAEGIVIDASNLELRPLLLGESFNHQILQNAKVIKLPKNLPYLEGILVTLASPPQILGIIPLGKTYLAETSYQIPSLGGLTSVKGSKIYINGFGNPNAASYSMSGKGPYTLAYQNNYAGPTKYSAYSGANGLVARNLDLESKTKALPVAHSIGNKTPQQSEGNYWGSGPYYHKVSNLPYPTAKWPSELMELNQRSKMPNAVIQHHYDQPLKTKKKDKSRKKPTDLKEDVTTVEPFLNINETESARRFLGLSFPGVLKNLVNIIKSIPSRRRLNSTEEVDIQNESESNNDLKEDVLTVEPFLNINEPESARRFLGLSFPGVLKNLVNIIKSIPSRRRLNSTEEVDIQNESESNNDLKEDVLTVEPFLNINEPESARRFLGLSFPGVLKNLVNIIKNIPSRRRLNSTEEVDIQNESESNNDLKEDLLTVEPFLNINESEPARRFLGLSFPGVLKNLLNVIKNIPSRRRLHSTEEVDIPNESESNNDLKEDLLTVEPFLNINESEPARRFLGLSFSGVVKNLMNVIKNLPSRRRLNSTEEVDIQNESESNNDGGAPDFRIIGGSAATGSGTPLSNKGRSGVEYA